MTKRILDEKQEIENYSSAYNIIPSSTPAICSITLLIMCKIIYYLFNKYRVTKQYSQNT